MMDTAAQNTGNPQVSAHSDGSIGLPDSYAMHTATLPNIDLDSASWHSMGRWMLIAIAAHILILGPIFILKQVQPEAPEVFTAMLLPMAPATPQAPAPAPKSEPVIKKSVPKPTPLPKPAPTDSKTAISQQQPVAAPTQSSEQQSTAAPSGADKPAPAVTVPPSLNAAYLNNPLYYPPMSKRNGEQGTVLVEVYVLADGTAGKVSLAKSSGFPRLDNSALDQVKQWKFVPAKRAGEAIAATFNVPVKFEIKQQ